MKPCAVNRQELQKKIVAERVACLEAEARVEELVAEKKRLETTILAHRIMHNAFVDQLAETFFEDA